eukprot:gnl/MRDRNA2_/MRDRNA2_104316_c0_seq1.p1 gnl/MRDRNA2_/MRDRNA2_104316_c0~~gnl/MRDRNA2_/MRDRNA2_104316_c0_seq1.p1  ORF type:complete len:869 (+),score=248.06 gnl/MRDRNA2_/MRDRNA2_104316_c0_seq1:67-2673(+)
MPKRAQGKVPAPDKAKAASNPYDVFQNRGSRKTVLGSKVKGAKRDLQRSRATAAAQRKNTLLAEFRSTGRTSEFIDKRFTSSTGGSLDDEALKRFSKLRKQQTKRKFNLDDADGGSDVLTHKGQKLSELEDSALRSGSDEDGDIDEKENQEALTKAMESDPRSREEIFKEIMLKSKERKAEEAKEREEQSAELSRLDSSYHDILAELGNSGLDFRKPKEFQPRGELDDYDKLAKDMQFDSKALAAERVKGPEELAREKAARLEELEKKRLARMHDLPNEKAEDNDSDPGSDDSEPGENKQEEIDEDEMEESEEEIGEESEEEADASESEQDENENIVFKKGDHVRAKLHRAGTFLGWYPAVVAEERKDGKYVVDWADSEPGDKIKTSNEMKPDSAKDELDAGSGGFQEPSGITLPCLAAADVNIMKNDRGEKNLPYSYVVPTDQNAVAELLRSHAPATQLKIVQRVRASAPAKLNSTNDAKLRRFLPSLLSHIVAASTFEGRLSTVGLEALYALRPALVELAGEYQKEAYEHCLECLQKYNPDSEVTIEGICFLKLVALLFPVTDFRHPIVTPALVLADHWAGQLSSTLKSDPGSKKTAPLIPLALLLLGTLFDLVALAKRYSASLMILGLALLETLWSVIGDNPVYDAAAGDVGGLMQRALALLGESSPTAARVTVEQVTLPFLREFAGRADLTTATQAQLDGLIESFGAVCSDVPLEPLKLHMQAPPQIKVFDPIFHEGGDAGEEPNEATKLRREATTARRQAARQLRRDAGAVMQIRSHDQERERLARAREKKRVRKMMDQEDHWVRQSYSQHSAMDTSLNPYSKNKKAKKENPRMAGNRTQAPSGANETPRRTPRGGKRAKGKE